MVSELRNDLMGDPNSSYTSIATASIVGSHSLNSSVVLITLPPFLIKLIKDHYISWKTQVLAIFRAFDLEGFITGAATFKFPLKHSLESSQATRKVNPEFVTWNRIDQLILS